MANNENNGGLIFQNDDGRDFSRTVAGIGKTENLHGGRAEQLVNCVCERLEGVMMLFGGSRVPHKRKNF